MDVVVLSLQTPVSMIFCTESAHSEFNQKPLLRLSFSTDIKELVFELVKMNYLAFCYLALLLNPSLVNDQ